MNTKINADMCRVAATALNIKLYYGTLAKAEGRSKNFSTKMYMTDATGVKAFMTHITPQNIADMRDDQMLVFLTFVNGQNNCRTYKKSSLLQFDFAKTRSEFLNNVRTRERAVETKTETIYNMLYNSAKLLKEEEDAYYEKLAEEAAMQRDWEIEQSFGHCDDHAWQAGVN